MLKLLEILAVIALASVSGAIVSGGLITEGIIALCISVIFGLAVYSRIDEEVVREDGEGSSF